jgi:membrane peptidoglycan carboxypeptidase
MSLENHKKNLKKHGRFIFDKGTSLFSKKPSGPVWGWIKNYGFSLLWIMMSIGVILLVILIVWIASLKVPTLDSFADRKVSSSTKIYDQTGEIVLYDVHENIKRTVVKGDEISTTIKQAIIAIEDKDFYSHKGIQVSSTKNKNKTNKNKNNKELAK